MNYELSEKILEEIKNAKRILVNYHRSPDPDAIGCALAMYKALKEMGKDVKVIGPDEILEYYKFLPDIKNLEKIDFSTFDFSSYNLFIVLDSSNWRMAARGDFQRPKIKTVVIDHHKTNEMFGDINLVDEKLSSCAELVYKLFEDWGVKIDKEIAQVLLTGILADTGIFQYPGANLETFEISQKLMKLGADKDEIIFNIERRIDFAHIKMWGEILRKIQIDHEYKFVWSAVDYETYEKFGKPESAKESAASKFSQNVEGTDFGMIMVEEQKRVLSVSFRSRTGFDVSKVALKLGGGGHIGAAGGKVSGLAFDEAVKKVLDAAREAVDENKS